MSGKNLLLFIKRRIAYIAAALLILAVAIALNFPKLVDLQSARANRLPSDVEALLEDAEEFQLISLDPDEGRDHDSGLHGWKKLGAARITDAQERRALLAALSKGMAENHNSQARCFQPRHALRAIDGDESVDLVICFECLSLVSYTTPEKKGFTLLTSDSPRTLFDETLRRHGIPLPKPPD